MSRAIKIILANVLKTLYKYGLFALVLSILVLFFVMYLEKYKGISVKDRVLSAFKDWKNKFITSSKYRRLFYLVFVFVLILFKTTFNRDFKPNPLSDVVGAWQIHNSKGYFTTQVIGNIILFIPLFFLLFFFLETTSIKTSKLLRVIGISFTISFLLSLTIETSQLILHSGAWQLSDLAFNTLGGVIGGLIYWVSAKIRRI